MMARVRMARIVSANVVVVVIDCCDHHQCKMRNVFVIELSVQGSNSSESSDKKTEFAVVALL